MAAPSVAAASWRVSHTPGSSRDRPGSSSDPPRSPGGSWRPSSTVVDSLDVVASAVRSVVSSPDRGSKVHVFDHDDVFDPDTCPYPRKKDAWNPKNQREQSWTCPLCGFMVRAPAGPRARLMLRWRKDNHLTQQHKDAYGKGKIPRLNQKEPAPVASSALPVHLQDWVCHLCGEALPRMSHRFTHDRAIQEHFRAKHPGVTPTEAYRAKQREDKEVRARMSVRGHKVGALKRAEAQAKLEVIRNLNGHLLDHHVFRFCPAKHKRGQSVESNFVCRRCWRSGGSNRFAQVSAVCRGPSDRMSWWRHLCRFAAQSSDNVVHLRNMCGLSDEVTAILLAGAPLVRRINGKRPLRALDSLPRELEQSPVRRCLAPLARWVDFPPCPPNVSEAVHGEPEDAADVRLGGHRNERVGEAAHPGSPASLSWASRSLCAVFECWWHGWRLASAEYTKTV